MCLSTDGTLVWTKCKPLCEQLISNAKKFFSIAAQEGSIIKFFSHHTAQSKGKFSLDQVSKLRESTMQCFNKLKSINTDEPFRTDRSIESEIANRSMVLIMGSFYTLESIVDQNNTLFI